MSGQMGISGNVQSLRIMVGPPSYQLMPPAILTLMRSIVFIASLVVLDRSGCGGISGNLEKETLSAGLCCNRTP